jgi:hypothetical protein
MSAMLLKLLSRIENGGLWPLLSRSDAGDGHALRTVGRKFIRRTGGWRVMTINQISAYVIVYEERFLLEKEFGKFAQSLF